MTRLEQLRTIRERVLQVAAEHGATNVRVFGSIATGDEREGSDIDFLVSLEEGRNLFDRPR
jgi:predicted nucleotidyltransferase